MPRIGQITIVLLGVATLAMAQGFQASLFNFMTLMTETCDGGAPLDGTFMVKVYWDNDNNGPDDDDPPPPLGDDFPWHVNIVQFPMGGEFGDGYFGGSDVPDFYCTTTIPIPNKFFVRICLNGPERWESDTFSVYAGYQSIFFGDGFVAINCLPVACPGRLSTYDDFFEHELTDNLAGASDVVSADFDGDGDSDVAGVGFLDDRLAWWENHSEGINISFEGHVIASGQDGIVALATGRVNAGDLPDIVSVSMYANELRWWESHANGEFTPHLIAENLGDVCDVAIGNIDGLTDLELATAQRDAGQICWWENNDGNFTNHAIDEMFPSATAVSIGDLNEDDRGDVVAISREPGQLTWWEKNVGNSFTRHDIDSEIYLGSGVDVGDLDGDGDMDIAVSIAGYDEVRWYENLGNETFERHVVVHELDYVRNVLIADVNNDGLNDLVTASMWMDDISWWRNTRNDLLRNIVSGNFHQATAVKVANLNGDGIPDMVAAGGSKITVWISNPSVTPPLTHEVIQPGQIDGGANTETDVAIIPTGYSLSIFPNPFNPLTTIEFGLPKAGDVTITVFDINGRVVQRADRGHYEAGFHPYSFDGTNLSTGVYFARIAVGEFVMSKKMMLLK